MHRAIIMESSKYSRFSSPENQRSSASTPSVKTKAAAFVSDTVTSKSRSTNGHTARNPKIIQRCPSRNPMLEMKRSSRETELECHLAQLEEDMKRTKDRLGQSESLRRQAQKEAEEAKKQHAILSAKYVESRCEFESLVASEEARNRELYVISKEMDRAWQAELEATLDHHSVDLAALNSARNEIHRLKKQLEAVADSKAARAKQYEEILSELEASKRELTETLASVEKLKVRISDCERAKASAQAHVDSNQQQLDVVNADIESLRSEQSKLKESSAAVNADLAKSRSRENSLEVRIRKIQNNLSASESEAKKLTTELEESLTNHLEEQVKNTVRAQSAFESVDRLRRQFGLREAVLNSELANTNSKNLNLREKLFDKEMRVELANNELLKRYRMVAAEVESSRAKEREASERIAIASGEAEKSNVFVARTTERLDAMRAAVSETDAEIRRQRVRMEQWRKAAEAAVAIIAEEEDESSNNVLKKIYGFWKDLTIT